MTTEATSPFYEDCKPVPIREYAAFCNFVTVTFSEMENAELKKIPKRNPFIAFLLAERHEAIDRAYDRKKRFYQGFLYASEILFGRPIFSNAISIRIAENQARFLVRHYTPQTLGAVLKKESSIEFEGADKKREWHEALRDLQGTAARRGEHGLKMVVAACLEQI